MVSYRVLRLRVCSLASVIFLLFSFTIGHYKTLERKETTADAQEIHALVSVLLAVRLTFRFICLFHRLIYVRFFPFSFCFTTHRSDTPLIYKAVPSWFVKVEQFQKRLLEINAMSYW